MTEPIKILASIIQTELGLPNGQVMLGLENFPIAPVLGLYVALEYGSEQVVGSVNSNGTDAQGNFQEIQSVSMMHTIEIDCMSFDDSARLRKEEVVMSFSSYNAQQLMEKNQVRIGSIPTSFLAIPSPEPTKQLNRYRFTIAVYALHQRVLMTPYYDSLQPVRLVENP